jgi:hypothetical protein
MAAFVHNPGWDGLFKLFIISYFIQPHGFAIFCALSNFYELLENIFLVGTAVAMPFRIPLYIYEANGFAKNDLIFIP